MSLLDNLYDQAAGNGTGSQDALCVRWKEEFPTIHEFITATQFKGKDRQPGKLQLTSDLGVFRASLIENQLKAMLTITSPDLDVAIRELNQKAIDPDVEWHRWGKTRGTKKRG